MNKPASLLIAFVVLCLAACQRSPQDALVSASRAADAVAFAVAAHRYNYTAVVVERLSAAHVVSADEDYDGATKKLPLPAQLLRLSGEHMARSPVGSYASFALISDYAIHGANRPRTAFEKAGLAAVKRNPSAPYRGVQTLGGQRWFSAMYADRAVTRACADCHNRHPDSPRHDFRLGETMGALIVSIALEN